jgi:hypothetical protein
MATDKVPHPFATRGHLVHAYYVTVTEYGGIARLLDLNGRAAVVRFFRPTAQ